MSDPKPGHIISPARRRLLRALSVSGSAGVLAKVLPEHWLQPVINAVVLPAHAQCTTLEFLNCHVRVRDANESAFDVSVNGPDSRLISIGFSTGVVNAVDLIELRATVCEEVSGIPVTLTINGVGTQQPGDLTCTLSSYTAPIVQNTNNDGVANFADLTGGTLDEGCTWQLVFSAPGYGECEIELMFSP